MIIIIANNLNFIFIKIFKFQKYKTKKNSKIYRVKIYLFLVYKKRKTHLFLYKQDKKGANSLIL